MQFPITPDERMKRANEAGLRAWWLAFMAEYHEIPHDKTPEASLDDATALAMQRACLQGGRTWLVERGQLYWSGLVGAEPPFGKPAAPKKNGGPVITPMHVPQAKTTPESPLAQLGTPGHSHVSWLERNLDAQRAGGKWFWPLIWCVVAIVGVGALWWYKASH